MRKYWLILYPDTFLWVKHNRGYIYNAKNYAKIYFENKGELAELTEVLLDINRLYRVDLSEELLQKQQIKEWVDDIIKTESGQLVRDNGVNKRPVSIKPVLKLQDGVNYYEWEHKRGIDGNVINNLHKMIFHINGSDYGNISYTKQTAYYPVQTDVPLNRKDITTFAMNARSSAFLLELAFVGDIASYPAFKKLLSDILDIGYGKLSVYCLTNDFLRYIQDNKDWKNDSISYTVLVSDYSAIDEHISIIKQLPISFIFLVRSEEDYEHATSCIERNELANIEIAPIYTEDNLSFFEDNLYMDEEDISEIELSHRYYFSAVILISPSSLLISREFCALFPESTLCSSSSSVMTLPSFSGILISLASASTERSASVFSGILSAISPRLLRISFLPVNVTFSACISPSAISI